LHRDEAAVAQERDFSEIFARWRLWVPVAWIGAMIWFAFERWNMIRAFTLSDTDDNLRMAQVRAWLHGQGWFDLRQYRLDPPFGADIHWSRLVDLPIAGIMLVLRPLIGGRAAEQAAAAIAPMLPMGLAILAIALIARRMIAPKSLLLALVFLACAHVTRNMWMPMRIDHHGWQLALLAMVLVGITAPNPLRGGMVAGLASAASLTIGLEMLIYLAVAGALTGARWILDGKSEQLAGYGIALGGGCAAGFLLFASYANRAPVCDALSPVWLSALVLAGALCVLLAMLRPASWQVRLALAAVAAVALGGAFALVWPQCLGRLEGVSPEAQRLWLNNVREAKPIYTQSSNTIATFVSLPVFGLVGYAVMLWASRRDRERLIGWASMAALAATSAALLLWQTRAGPAANLLAVPGAAGAGWLLLVAIHKSRFALVRVLGTVIGFVALSGLGVQIVAGRLLPPENQDARSKAIGKANRTCPTMSALRPIGLQPKGYVLTFIDLGPRLITVTHHNAVAGPYHRNHKAIVDVMQTWQGTPEHALQTVERRKIDYVLICPMMSESTNYQVRAPQGFYAQLAKGKVPKWLQPIALPKDSPFKMWRVSKNPSPQPSPARGEGVKGQ
jgi:hypothetical protein